MFPYMHTHARCSVKAWEWAPLHVCACPLLWVGQAGVLEPPYLTLCLPS